MSKVLCCGVLLVALVPLMGCSPSPDTLVQRQIDEMNELAEAIESGVDQAKLDAIGKRMQQTKSALEDLDLSDEEKKRLAEKYGKATMEAAARLAKANMSKMGGVMQGMMKGLQQGMQGLQGMPAGLAMP